MLHCASMESYIDWIKNDSLGAASRSRVNRKRCFLQIYENLYQQRDLINPTTQ